VEEVACNAVLALLWHTTTQEFNVAEDPDKPEEIPFRFNIQFETASPNIYEMAEQILAAKLLCPEELRKRIRAVCKALIDETDEMQRAGQEMRANRNDTKVQLDTISPPEVVEKAKTLLHITLSNKRHQEKVHLIAQCYVGMAEFNQKVYEEFVRKYGHLFPPRKDS
jgi:hypothetical protein